jgi:hypothetical protein
MALDKTPRELQSREKETHESFEYTPASILPTPDKRPGLVHHWVATHIMGKPDPTNVSKKLRDGWVPCKAADYPELMLIGSEATGNVEIGGLMLCAMDERRAKAMSNYYSGQANAQMESVDNNYMKNNDPRMPLFAEKKSTTTRGSFGSGSK